MDQRFGRCTCFILIDTDSGEFSVLDNQGNAGRSGGAGIQAAELIAGTDTEAVVTGHCGPKAFSALSEINIPVYGAAESTIAEALDQFKSGALKKFGAPDVESHWK